MDTELIMYIRRLVLESVDLTENLDTLDDDDDLTEYGLNSLSFIKIIIRIEEDYDVCLDDYEIDDYDEYVSINKFVSLIEKVTK